MGILGNAIRHWFQKHAAAFGPGEAERRNQSRSNPLFFLDPDVLVRHMTAFSRGDICGLERILEEFETREDKMRIGAFKMAAAVASKPWEVRVRKGEEDNPRAKLHRDVLTRFWTRIEVTDAFCRNRKGGLRLLVKQMMEAQSRVYSVHDIAWKPNADGTLDARFTHVPAWCFENRTGRLRYIRNDGQAQGEEMRDGEWLVAVGEGVGIAAAVLAMAKRLSWNDWLLFSEKCGMPVILGNTSAQRGTPAWEAMVRSIRSVAPKTGILADTGTQLSAVPMGAKGEETYRALVEVVDRAVSALYRGGDLATVSSAPGAAGINAQAGESELMDADGCAMVSETLRDQVEKFVVRFVCGDFEPLAEIVVNPPAETEDIDREIKIDSHLSGMGVKLSKAEALARYGRAEAADEDDALSPVRPQGGLPGFGNFGRDLPDIGKGLANELPSLGKNKAELPDLGKTDSALLRSFAADTSEAAKRLAVLLEKADKGEDIAEEARKLAEELPGLMPEEPAMAEELATAMAEAFAEEIEAAKDAEDAKEEKLANENPYHCPKCGKFSGFDGHCDKCGFVLKGKEARARTAALLEKAARDAYAKPVRGLAYREELGRIDLETGTWGEFVPGKDGGGEWQHGRGLSKIRGKHGGDLDHLPDTLAFGRILRTRTGDRPDAPENPDRRAIVHDGYVAFATRTGKNTWAIATHWKPEHGMVATLEKIAETFKDSAKDRRQVQ